MTSVERRVRDAMQEEPLTHGAGWTAVVQRAEARRRRRRLVERASFVGLLSAICALTLLVTVGVPGASSPAAGEGGTGLGWGADWVISLAGLSAIGLGTWAWWLWRRRSSPPAPAQRRAAASVAAAVLAIGSVVWPLWVYASHLRAIDDRVDELSALAGVEVTDVDRHRSPLVGSYEPIATATVEVVGATGDARIDELDGALWVDVRRGADGRTTVDLLRGWSPDPSVLPAVLLVGTYGLALAAVIMRRNEVGRRLARLVGVLTVVQSGLLAFALWRTAAALATYRAALGLDTFGVEEFSRAGFFSTSAGRTLYERIHDVAGPLYPMGGWSAVLLLAPWAVAIAVGGRGAGASWGRLQAVLAALALAAAAAAASFPHNDVVLWILE